MNAKHARTAGLIGALLVAAGCESQADYRLRVAEDLFDRKCAECHGGTDGEGPRFVEGFGAKAPDLRRLGFKYGTPLPKEKLAAFIDGRQEVAAHGSREMPVWGEELYANFPEQESVEDVRAGTISMLVDYLESIQVDLDEASEDSE